MNISTDRWIPVIWQNGRSGTASLTETFAHAQEIQDLTVRPHERIALMRLLICIAQVALNGPEDQDDWKLCERIIAPKALDYLKRWHAAFELFGNDQRFLQISGLKIPDDAAAGDKGSAASKLDVALATGNNATLFDNAGGAGRIFSPAKLALMLLTYQCFSPGGTIGVATWNGKPTPGWDSYPKAAPGRSEHAPCLPRAMLHAFLRGRNLAETVRLNLLSKHLIERTVGSSAWGKPVWEAMPTSPVDEARLSNATRTYLGRLVPLSRAIWLDEQCSSLLLANGLTYPPYPEMREPSATVVVRKENGTQRRDTLAGSLGRAPWRELHSLTVRSEGEKGPGGPLALKNLGDVNPGFAFDLWVGALVTRRAHVLDTIEAVYHVPAAMLEEDGQAQRIYTEGVEFAKNMEFRLRRAMSDYRKSIGEDLNRPELRSRRGRVQEKAANQYWTTAESEVNHLLAIAESPSLLAGGWSKTRWGLVLLATALTTYESACPHNTARQMEAYVLGRRRLATTPAGH